MLKLRNRLRDCWSLRVVQCKWPHGKVVRIGWMWAWASAHMRPLALQSELNPRSIFAHVAKSSSAKSSRLRSENEIDCFTGLHADLAK